MNQRAALASYQGVKTRGGVESASPHQLINMLFEGLQERIAQAKGAMQYQNVALKGSRINSAIAILGGLRENLNQEEGGDLAGTLDSLYVYIQSILAKAHSQNAPEFLDEAAELVNDVHSAWKEISTENA